MPRDTDSVEYGCGRWLMTPSFRGNHILSFLIYHDCLLLISRVNRLHEDPKRKSMLEQIEYLVSNGIIPASWAAECILDEIMYHSSTDADNNKA